MHSDTEDDTFAKRFDGRFSNGATAGSHPVDVRLSKTGLLLTGPEGQDPIEWPYSSLSVAEPLRKNSIDALITSANQPGATLFVPGGVFARTLPEFAPQLTASRERWRNIRPWLLTTAAIAALIALIYVAELTPARYVASLIPNSVRQSIGKHSIQSMVGERGFCVAKDGRQALDTLVSRLSKASESNTRFNVTVADWGLFNAFATPGEQIIVTRGLIKKVQSPEEFAGVIAHEMGHGIARHPETGLVRAIGLTATLELMTGGGGGVLTNVGILLAQLSYTRRAEREADDYGLAILKEAKISPTGLEKFFERISTLQSVTSKSKKAKDRNTDDSNNHWTSNGLDMLRTHPSSKDRLARVKRQPDYPTTPAMSNADWTALRQICSKTLGGKPKTKNNKSGSNEKPTKEDSGWFEKSD